MTEKIPLALALAHTERKIILEHAMSLGATYIMRPSPLHVAPIKLTPGVIKELAEAKKELHYLEFTQIDLKLLKECEGYRYQVQISFGNWTQHTKITKNISIDYLLDTYSTIRILF